MKPSHHAVLVLGVLVLAARTLQAQPAASPPPGAAATDTTAGSNTQDGVALLSVPDIPALTALDATSNKLDRPDSASGLGAALANIIAADGSIRSGAAIEISPRAFGVDKTWGYNEYRSSLWRRILAQSSLSIGTSTNSGSSGAPGMGTSADTRAAIGARIVLFNDADPLLSVDYARAVAWAKEACKDVTPAPAKLACEVQKRPEYKGNVAVPWNAAGLFVATAATFDFPGGRPENIAGDTWVTWVAGAGALGDYAQLAGGLVWDHGWSTEDKLTIAARVRVGGSRFRFTGDGAWFAKRSDGAASGHWAVGAEIQLTSTSWLTLAVGDDVGGAMQPPMALLSSIKYGFSPKASWSPN